MAIPRIAKRRNNKNVGDRGRHEPYSRAQSPEVATPSHGVNGGLAAVDDGDDRERSQRFDSESQFEFANRQDGCAERKKAASQNDPGAS